MIPPPWARRKSGSWTYGLHPCASAELFAALVAVFIGVDGVRLDEVVLEHAVLQLFAGDARGFLRSRVLDQRRRTRHDLPGAARGQHNIGKLALWSFGQYIHFAHYPPNDAKSFSTRSWRRAVVQRSAVTMACASRPATATSSFTTQ